MLNRKIATSFLSIAMVLTLVGTATFAFFSDTAASNDNIFSTGNLDMELSSDNVTFTQNVTASFGISGGGPGTTFDDTLFVRNTGTVGADHLEFSFVNTHDESDVLPGSLNSILLASVIEITALEWDLDGNGSTETNLLPGISNSNANGIVDLEDLATQGLDNLSFGGTESVGHGLRIAGRFHPTQTVDQHQGDSVDTDITVTMNQDASQ